MFIVAGPPGGGKSTAFPVAGFGVDFFNADDHAAALNHGSYVAISRVIRDEVNRLFEVFIQDHIARGAGLAFETTLRSEITFEQAAQAARAGFEVEMRYVALQTFAMHIERVRIRADRGGHSAPESVLRGIYDSSLGNLTRAIREMGFLYVYDNSRWGVAPALLLQTERGEIIYQAEQIPHWLAKVLKQLTEA
jgi:predicted ABC-type ATPase